MNPSDGWTDQAASMLATMARMQDAHNRQVHPEWRAQGYPYYRAVWVECAELLDHFGWKWWKHQQPDLDQVKLEVVDIWHFGLSDLMRADALGPEVAKRHLYHARSSSAARAEMMRSVVGARMSSTIWPSLSISTRSAQAAAAGSWVTITTVWP